MARIPQCDVCGSSAPIMLVSSRHARTLNLCYHHEYVCWDHLSDPCGVCDAM